MSAVVLIHGMWLPGQELSALGRRLLREGFRPVRFPYRGTRTDIDESVRRLGAFLEGLPDEDVHLLGHSFGGLLALRLIAERPAQRPGRVVALGSPFNGSHSARRFGKIPILGLGMGEAGRALVDGFTNVPAGRDVGVIAGCRPYGLGRLLGGLQKPHDGVVAVHETQLAGARAHLVMPVSHTSMVFSREVARQAAVFLRYGCFLPPG